MGSFQLILFIHILPDLPVPAANNKLWVFKYIYFPPCLHDVVKMKIHGNNHSTIIGYYVAVLI